MLPQIAMSVALAFVYGGNDARMARQLDDVGLGTIAPADSVGIVIGASDGVVIHGGMQPLTNLSLPAPGEGQWVEHLPPDPDGALSIALAELDRTDQAQRVLIASDLDPAAVARISDRARAEHVQVLVGPPSLAREALDPKPLEVRCPSARMAARPGRRQHHARHRHGRWWDRLAASLALLGLAGVLARRATRV